MQRAKDTTLHISRGQYRKFAEETKKVGLALNLSSVKRLGAWGTYSQWALLVCKDATADDPQWHERALVTLASAINSAKWRACGPGRPELDWSILADEEIYDFILHHEIGHRVDNFDVISLMTDVKDPEIRESCHRRIRFVNEVLADRYAWNKVRPGQPIPVSKNGARLQKETAGSFDLLTRHVPRLKAPQQKYALSPGQYCDVPVDMLNGATMAAFIGPGVSRALLASVSAKNLARKEFRA